MHTAARLQEPPNGNLFKVHCDASGAGQFQSSVQRAAITVGQRILRDGAEEMWDSVVVLCQEEKGGALAIRVVLCHPDWDEPREIACLRSWVGTAVPRSGHLSAISDRMDVPDACGWNYDQALRLSRLETPCRGGSAKGFRWKRQRSLDRDLRSDPGWIHSPVAIPTKGGPLRHPVL